MCLTPRGKHKHLQHESYGSHVGKQLFGSAVKLQGCRSQQGSSVERTDFLASSGCTWTEVFRLRQQPTGSHQKPSTQPRTTQTARTAGVPQCSNAWNLMLSDDFTEDSSLQGPTLDGIPCSKPETPVQTGTLLLARLRFLAKTASKSCCSRSWNS